MPPKRNVSAAPSSGQSATTSTRSSAQLGSTFSSTAEVRFELLPSGFFSSRSVMNVWDSEEFLSEDAYYTIIAEVTFPLWNIQHPASIFSLVVSPVSVLAKVISVH